MIVIVAHPFLPPSLSFTMSLPSPSQLPLHTLPSPHFSARGVNSFYPIKPPLPSSHTTASPQHQTTITPTLSSSPSFKPAAARGPLSAITDAAASRRKGEKKRAESNVDKLEPPRLLSGELEEMREHQETVERYSVHVHVHDERGERSV